MVVVVAVHQSANYADHQGRKQTSTHLLVVYLVVLYVVVFLKSA
jgi:hypothetical protein